MDEVEKLFLESIPPAHASVELPQLLEQLHGGRRQSGATAAARAVKATDSAPSKVPIVRGGSSIQAATEPAAKSADAESAAERTGGSEQSVSRTERGQVGQVPGLPLRGAVGGSGTRPTSAASGTDDLKPLGTGSPEQASVVVTQKSSMKSGAPQSQSTSSSTLGSALTAITSTGFSAFPLFSGIASLFEGGGPAAPAPLQRYTPPPAIEYQGAVSSSNPGAIFGVDYSASGMPRATGTMANLGGTAADAPQAAPAVPVSPASSAGAQQITIQVQAMDSQSFLDHSDDIARAVKQAILNSNGLNDAIGEL